MENQRVQRWDNYKGLLITLVVTGHFLMYTPNNESAQIILLFIYSFHMPAFVLISGMMSKRAVDQKDLSKIIYFLLVFLLIKAWMAVSRLIIGYENGTGPIYLIDDVSWYAFALAVFYPLTMILSKCSRKKVIIISIAAACAAGYIDAISIFLSASRIFTFFPFFFIGYCLDKNSFFITLNNRKIRMTAKLALVSYGLLVVLFADKIWPLFGILQGKYPYSDFLEPGMMQFGGILRLIWYALSILLTVSVGTCCSDKRPLLNVGKKTLGIYVLHNPLIFIIMQSPIGTVLKQNTFYLIAAGIILTICLSFVPSFLRMPHRASGAETSSTDF